MQFLKANTAVDVLIGPFVDSTDGNTTEDALTISQADVKLSKNGQTLAQKSDATACAFDDDGYYNCELDATDTNTEGNLVLIVHESGALPVRHEFNILAEAAYDSMFTAKDTGLMDVNISTIDANAITAAAINADAITSAKIADNAIAAEHIAAAAIDNATFAADVGSTAYATNILALAVRKALDEIKLDHLIAIADADDVVDDSIIAKLASLGATADWSTYVNTTDSLQAIRDRGDAAWTTGGGTGLTALATGTAQSGTVSTIVLAAASAFANDILNGNIINIHTGTGAGQSRVIISNTLADDTCNVAPNWTTNPSSDSQYEIIQGSVNVEAVSLDSAAAGNLELDYDGTGYAKANSTIGTCTTNTDMVGTDSAATAVELAKVPKSDGTATWNATALASIEAEVTDSIEAHNLDHLCLTATAGADMTTEVADNTIVSRILANGDTSAFTPSTDGLQPIRDHIGDGTNLTEAGGDGDHLTAINLPNQTMDIIGDITGNLSGSVGSVTTKTGYALSAAGVDAIFDNASALTLDFGTLVERVYQMLNNKMNVTDATGAVALRAIGDGSDIATANISDNDTTTVRTENTWT